MRSNVAEHSITTGRQQEMDEVIEEVITPLTNNVLVRGGVKRSKSIYYNRFQVKAKFVKMDKSVCSTLDPSFFVCLLWLRMQDICLTMSV